MSSPQWRCANMPCRWRVARVPAQHSRAVRYPAMTVEIHERGLEIVERFGYSLYDSMIVAAALQAGCRTLYPRICNTVRSLTRA